MIKLFRAITLLLAGTLALGLAAVGWMVRPGAEVFRVVRTDSADHRWSPDQALWILLLGDD